LGRIVWLVTISLDGFMEGPNRELDWSLVDDELRDHMNEQLGPASAFLEGRVMYELMAAVWPAADADPRSTPPMLEFARIWLEKPKYVFSRTLRQAGWNSTIVGDVVPADIRALAARFPGDLVLGGADLAAEFLRQDLVDELRIYVHPVLIGRGRSPFPATDAHTPLRLLETRTFGNGVVMLRYERGGT
jgi:dihydrofolate reductase